MAIRIPLRVLASALYTLVLLGAAFGISYGVFEWRHDDEPTTEQPEAPSGASEVEKSFSMTLKTADDFEEAAQRTGAFMPDFDCTGEWNEESAKGTLDCSAGLTGFECDFTDAKGGRSGRVLCLEGEQPPKGFPACTVEPGSQYSYLVRCSAPSTDAFCEVRRGVTKDSYTDWSAFALTCQRP